jgi:hypothetical protein
MKLGLEARLAIGATHNLGGRAATELAGVVDGRASDAACCPEAFVLRNSSSHIGGYGSGGFGQR